MSGVSHMTFDSESYDSKDELFNDVSTMMRILTKNNFVCSFEYDDCGIYVLRFDYQDDCLAEYELRWVSEEERYDTEMDGDDE